MVIEEREETKAVGSLKVGTLVLDGLAYPADWHKADDTRFVTPVGCSCCRR